MSQIVVAQNINGIALAAENRAVLLNEEGQEITLQADRLLPLTSHTALLTAGSAEGIEMGHALKKFVQEEGFTDVQDLYGASLAFLSTEYERFMRKKCELVPLDPLHHVSFILAGKTAKDPAMPFRLYFLWTKKKLPQLDGEEISLAFSLPRRMGLEYQLNKLCREQGSPEQLLANIKEGMVHLRELGEVTSSVTYAIINDAGYQTMNI